MYCRFWIEVESSSLYWCFRSLQRLSLTGCDNLKPFYAREQQQFTRWRLSSSKDYIAFNRSPEALEELVRLDSPCLVVRQQE